MLKKRRINKRINKIIFLMVIILLFFNLSVTAASLWDDESADIYISKKKEYQLGDVITVIIEESADATNSANTSISQGSNADAGAGIGIFDFLASFGFSYSDQDDSEGETVRSGSINANITTMIVDVYSNGNFKIEGTKRTKINGEEQIIKISGVIRPEDINDENDISSQKIADADIEFDGKGVVTEKQSPNIFQKILNWIF